MKKKKKPTIFSNEVKSVLKRSHLNWYQLKLISVNPSVKDLKKSLSGLVKPEKEEEVPTLIIITAVELFEANTGDEKIKKKSLKDFLMISKSKGYVELFLEGNHLMQHPSNYVRLEEKEGKLKIRMNDLGFPEFVELTFSPRASIYIFEGFPKEDIATMQDWIESVYSGLVKKKKR